MRIIAWCVWDVCLWCAPACVFVLVRAWVERVWMWFARLMWFVWAAMMMMCCICVVWAIRTGCRRCGLVWYSARCEGWLGLSRLGRCRCRCAATADANATRASRAIRMYGCRVRMFMVFCSNSTIFTNTHTAQVLTLHKTDKTATKSRPGAPLSLYWRRRVPYRYRIVGRTR